MYVRRIENEEQFSALEPTWNRLAGTVPFRRFEWLGSWWRHYGRSSAGSTHELCVLVIYDGDRQGASDDRIVGLFPCYIERSWKEGRSLRFLGTGEVCTDYLSILCEPEDAIRTATAIADWLSGDGASAWDVLDVSSISPEDRALSELVEQLNRSGHHVDRRAGEGCWRIALPDSWDDYVARLSKSHRKQVRRADRRYLDSGRATFHIVGDGDALQDSLASMIELHQRRRGRRVRRDCFDSPRFLNFLRDVANRLQKANLLQISLLKMDGQIVAADFNLKDNHVLYAFQGGIDPNRLDVQPGSLLTIATLRDAIRKGVAAYDFLRGDEPYKAHWRAERRDVDAVRLFRNTVPARFRHALWQTEQTMRRCARGGCTHAPTTIAPPALPASANPASARPISKETTDTVKAPLHVRATETLAELSALESDWNALAGDHALRRYDWLQCWWEHFGAADRDGTTPQRTSQGLLVLTVEAPDGHVVGLAPWYWSRSATGARVIRFLGSGEVCTDYQTILCRPDRETDVVNALANWLIAQHDTPSSTPRLTPRSTPWSQLELTAVDCEDNVIRSLADRLAANGHRVHQRMGDNCWRVALPESWDDYVTTLTAKKRAHVRRAVRNLFDTGRVVLHEVEAIDQLDSAFEIFRRLHQKRRESVGDPGCFRDPHFAAFLRDTAERFVRAGRMDLLWLELDGIPIAAEFNPHGGGVIYGYQGGIDPDARRVRPGPGNLINIARIRRAIARGDTALDFLRGDEPYKLDWQAVRRPLTEYRIVPHRPADQVRHHVWLAEQQARGWAKRGLSVVRNWKRPKKTSPKPNLKGKPSQCTS